MLFCSIHRYISAYYSNFLAGSNRCIVDPSNAFIRLLLVRYSFAENTSFAFTGIPINIGSPALGLHSKTLQIFLFHKLIDRCGFSRSQHLSQIYAKSFTFYLFRNNLLFWQTELRNSRIQHSAELMAPQIQSHHIQAARSPAYVRDPTTKLITATLCPFFSSAPTGLIS